MLYFYIFLVVYKLITLVPPPPINLLQTYYKTTTIKNFLNIFRQAFWTLKKVRASHIDSSTPVSICLHYCKMHTAFFITHQRYE